MLSILRISQQDVYICNSSLLTQMSILVPQLSTNSGTLESRIIIDTGNGESPLNGLHQSQVDSVHHSICCPFIYVHSVLYDRNLIVFVGTNFPWIPALVSFKGSRSRKKINRIAVRTMDFFTDIYLLPIILCVRTLINILCSPIIATSK